MISLTEISVLRYISVVRIVSNVFLFLSFMFGLRFYCLYLLFLHPKCNLNFRYNPIDVYYKRFRINVYVWILKPFMRTIVNRLFRNVGCTGLGV